MKAARAACILAILVGGCGDADAPVRLTAGVDTVDGVIRLSYPAGPAGDLGWTLDTVAVLGDAFAEDAYQFDQVTANGLASDPAGSLYLLDRQGKRVLRYGAGGEHLATLGREGEGPGELSQPLSLAVGPGDTIWVSDFSNRRFTGYPQDGGDPRTVAFGDETGIPGAMAVAGDGFVATFRQLFMFSRGAGGTGMSRGDGGEGTERTVPVLRLDRSLQPLDTLWESPEPPMDMVQLEVGAGFMVTMMSREFWPQFRWDEFPDGGVALVDSAAYAVHVLDPDGSRRLTLLREPAPRAVTEADRDLARQRVRDESGQGGGVRIGGGGPDEDMQEEILRQRLEKMTFADVIPRIVELRVDPAGRIWVGVSEDTPGEAARIDVYDRDGTLLGELRDFPFPDVFLGPDRIGILRRDELDVQQVVILRVRPPRPS